MYQIQFGRRLHRGDRFLSKRVGLLLMQSFVSWNRLDLRTPHLQAQIWRAAVGLMGMGTYFSAVALLPLATAITLQYTCPLFMAVVLALWFREVIAPRVALMLVLGFIGIVLLLQPTISRDQWKGAAVGLVAGFIATLALLNVRRLGQLGEPEWRTVYYLSGMGTLVGLAWALISGGFHAVNFHDGLLLIGVGAFGTMGQVAMTTAFKRGKALVAANLSYSTVVFGSIFGVVIWDETLPASALAGTALIVLSGMVMTAVTRTAPVDPD